MAQQYAVGPYNLYVASYALDPAQRQTAKFDVSTDSGLNLVADTFKNTADLSTTCVALSSTPPPFVYLGCYTDSGPQRALSGAAYSDTAMTVEECAASCSKFLYFGVEYGQQCYCGNTQDSGSAQVTDIECNFPCPGNSQETCGAGDLLNVYENLEYIPVTNPTI